MAEHDNDFGNFLAGFIIGGLVGAAAALLMAPQSGEETRTVIKEKSIELKDRASETAEDARLRAERALEDARMRADDALVNVRSRAEEVAKTAKDKASDLQQRSQTLIDEQRAKLDSAVDAGKKAANEAARKLNEESGTSTPDAAGNETGGEPSI